MPRLCLKIRSLTPRSGWLQASVGQAGRRAGRLAALPLGSDDLAGSRYGSFCDSSCNSAATCDESTGPSWVTESRVRRAASTLSIVFLEAARLCRGPQQQLLQFELRFGSPTD